MTPPIPSVLAVGAHPDDIEFLMAGTLFHLRDRGWEVHLIALADGCCGSMRLGADETAALRSGEARRAAARLGARLHPPIGRDIEIVYGIPLLRRLAAVVRTVAPTVVLAHSPQDYMEDHEAAARLAASAAFVRGAPNFETDPPAPAIPGPVAVYHAQPHGNRDSLGVLVRPALLVDLGAVLARKSAMLAEHASQEEWLGASQGLGGAVEAMTSFGAEAAVLGGAFTHAEGWRRHNPLGLGPADFDPLPLALGDRCRRATVG